MSPRTALKPSAPILTSKFILLLVINAVIICMIPFFMKANSLKNIIALITAYRCFLLLPRGYYLAPSKLGS